ncbi:c-type cytochrome [Acidocella sp.]|jgi:cytochrome c|uniref:c-type cytochrome n=1 Tax=Acidocella sp. TaxID=50710 RepID=UPI002F3F3215
MIIRALPRTFLLNLSALGVMGFTLLACMAVAMAADDSAPGEAAAKASDCFSCHSTDQKLVGPAFTAVAQKFAGQPGAASTLEGAIKNGHVGTWGQIPMPAHPQLSDAQLQQIVAWILSLKAPKSAATAAPGQTYTTTVNGKPVTTSFPIFQPGTQKVTQPVFRGYELFDSYCFRCHGSDAVGGEYAPNLRASLNNGMTESQFLSIAMEGRKAQGMPAWAGFFSPQDIDAIYQYTKARAIGAVDTGTPPQ